MPASGPAAGHDRRRRHHQEPDRNVLALGDVAFLARFFQPLLCRIFCLLAVVLLFGQARYLTVNMCIWRSISWSQTIIPPPSPSAVTARPSITDNGIAVMKI